MSQTKETDEEFSLEADEEDENYLKLQQSLDSMVSRRARKYKNYSHPCLRKSTEDLISDQINQSDLDKVESHSTNNRSADCSTHRSSDRKLSFNNSSVNSSSVNSSSVNSSSVNSSSVNSSSVNSPSAYNTANTNSDDRSSTSNQMMEKTKSTSKETSKENTHEYRVIHRPPLPPSTSKLIYKQMPNLSEFQANKTPNFNDIIDSILSSNANIKEYLRELRKNSELDYLLLSKILEKTLVAKRTAYVQTDEEPMKTYRSVETNTISPALCQKQTQTRESRILSYKLLETENLFEKLKIQNNFTNSNYEIKRTADLRTEEEPNDHEYERRTEFGNRTQYEERTYESCRRNCCTNCNHRARNRTIKIEDKFSGNEEKINLWNNLLQVDNTSEYSEDNSNVTTNQSTKQETTTASENQSMLSDDDHFSVSTRKSKKSYSSVKSTKSMKDELLSERETDLIQRYKRIKDFKSKYEDEKKEFIELRKQFKNLRRKYVDKKGSKRTKLEFDEYHQPVNKVEQSFTKERTLHKEQIKEEKKSSFDYKQPTKYTRFQCEEQFDLPVYETSIDESETTAFDSTNKDDEENSYLTDSEYSVLDRHLDRHTNEQSNKNVQADHTKNVEFIDQESSSLNDCRTNQQIESNQSAVKTESKILIETTNMKKKEISEISSQTELTKDGLLSRKTQVTNVKKVPVLVPIVDHLHHYNNKTPEPIIISPSAATTPSATLQRKSPKRKQRSNTVEIHSVPPSTNCSRPTSAMDLNHPGDNKTAHSPTIQNRSPKLPSQSKGKFFTNSYSEGELNAMKKDKNSILMNEQLNFGISEPFMAYDSAIYDDEERKDNKMSKIYQETPSSKALKMTFQRKPGLNKRLIENSNLQQIVEWQETNSSTITNEINSEPVKSGNGSTRSAKQVSLTTETTLQNNGTERTIETKSKAIRKFDLDKDNEKENQSTKLTGINDSDGNRNVSRRSSSRSRHAEPDEETSFNPAETKCNKCVQNKIKTNRMHEEKTSTIGLKDASMCVYKNVNLDYDYLNTLFDRPFIDYKPNSNNFQPYDSYDAKLMSTDQTNDKLNQINDNLSKLSFDSGHSSSMSSISYQTKSNQTNGLDPKANQDSNLDNLGDLNNLNLSMVDSGSRSTDDLNSTMKNESSKPENDLLVTRPIDEFSRSLVPKLKCSNLVRNTEIINRITKTVYPEMIKKKKIKKKKFVFEQQLNSPSNDQEQNDCKISSLITMEIPCNLRRKSKCSKCEQNQRQTSGKYTETEYYESTSFNPELEPNLTSLSSNCSSETDSSLINEEDLNTLTKFQKFKPVLINQDDDQTTWEYSLECNCFNGVNASVKTTVTQFHQKNKTSFLDTLKTDEQLT